MIIKEENFTAERSGIKSETGFKINASSKAFKILSDGLYSNKIAAPIRELSTNAWDAHVAAGTTDKMFEVHLPNNLEPWFSIRDYGTGLDHDTLMNLYTTYFWSDKSDSNDFTGAMGLGSKSPFAYTDSFTVTSYYNGEKRVYNAFLEAGLPKIAQFDLPLAQQKTDEENGLEINFGVKTNDIREFEREARNVFKYFTVRPKVVGVANFEFEERGEVILEGNGWAIRKTKSTYYSHRTRDYAVMGNIAYPITHHNFSYSGIGNCEMQFEIGELDIAASREELSYDDETIKKISDKYKFVKEEIEQKIQEKFDSLIENTPKSEVKFQARCMYKQLFSDSQSYIRGLQTKLNVEINRPDSKFHGERITSNIVSLDISYSASNLYIVKSNSKYKKNQKTLECSENNVYVEYDVNGAISRCIHYMDESRKNNKKIDYIYVVKFDNNLKRKDFCDKMGFSSRKLIKASTLPKPPKKSNYKKSVKNKLNDVKFCSLTNGVRGLNGYGNAKISRWMSTVNIEDITKGTFYYVSTHSNSIEYPQNISIYNFNNSYIHFLSDHSKLSDEKIYFVNATQIKKVKKLKNWINLFDYCKTLCEHKSNNMKFYSADTIKGIRTQSLFKCISENKNIVDYISEKKNSLHDFYETCKEAMDEYKSNVSLSEMVSAFKMTQNQKEFDLNGEIKKLKDYKPVLTFANKSNTYYVQDDMIEMIKYCEEFQEMKKRLEKLED